MPIISRRKPRSQELQDPPIAELQSGKSIEREISVGQKHSYKIVLAAGEYVDLAVEQRGIDVAVEVLNAEGKAIADVDLDLRLQGSERVEIVADAPQVYVINIQAKAKASPGRYEIRFTELRVATDKDHKLEEARKLNRDVSRLQAADKIAEARPLAERVLAIREEVLEPEHPEVTRAIQSLARIYYLLEDYPKAEPLYHRVIAIREKTLPPDHPDLAGSLTGLANVYYVEELYTRANPLYRRALEIKEKAFGPDHPEVARAVNLLANSLDESHDYAQAELLYQRVLSMHEKIYGPNHQMYARALGNLSITYKNRGDYSGAERFAQRALVIFEKTYGKDTREFGPLLMSLGNIYFELGEYAKAVSFYKRFMLLEQLSPNKLDLTIALHNLGNTYVAQGEYAMAEELLKRALAIREEVYSPDHPIVARSLNALASLYRAQGDYEKAEPLYRRALMIYEKAVGANAPDVLGPLRGLAILYNAKGDSVQSVSYQKRVNEIVERNVTYNLVAGSERQKLAYLAVISEDADRAVSLNVRSAPDDVNARSLGVTTVLERKGRVLDSMTDDVTALRRRLSADDQALLDRFNETISQLANLVLNGPQGKSLTEHQNKIRTLEEQKERIETDISHRSAGFYRQSQPITLAAVQAAIPAAAALIEFSVYRPFDPKAKSDKQAFGEPRYVVYIVRREGTVQFRELGEAKAIDGAVDDLRQALRDPRRKEVRELARVVDEKLIQPIRAAVGDATQLLVSPDGELNLIPFEALVDEQGKYLVERYAITYLTSGRDLLRLQNHRDTGSRPLVVANPSFGEPGPDQLAMAALKPIMISNRRRSVTSARSLSEVYFAPLSGTAQEARTIQTFYPETNLLTGPQATETALKAVAAPRLLHVATHGFFLEDDGKQSTGSSGSRVPGQIPSRKIRSCVRASRLPARMRAVRVAVTMES